MEEKDIIEQLFEKKDSDGVFYFDNEILKKLDKKTSDLNDEIEKFIDKRIHPKFRNRLNNLLDEYNRTNIEYYNKERGLIYENDFSDGVKAMMIVLSNN